MSAHDDPELFGLPAVEAFEPTTDGWRARQPFPILLTCEHASNRLPPGYAWSAADAPLATEHWAFDPGARSLCVELQSSLDCPALLSCFSRLFVDINRKELKVTGNVDDFGLTPFLTTAEDRTIELNACLDEAEMERRLAGAWRPYHRTLSSWVQRSPASTLLFSIHTFTRIFNPGNGKPIVPRAVEVGVLCRPATDLQPGMPARLLLDHLRAAGIDARINDPYGSPAGPGGAVGAYADGRRTLMIEVRNDLIEAPGFRAKLLAGLLHCVGAQPRADAETLPSSKL